MFGYSVGSPMTIDVIRGGNRSPASPPTRSPPPTAAGSSSTTARSAPPRPATASRASRPTSRPGDVVRVTADGGTDEVTVDNVRIDVGPTEQPSGDMTMQGIAERFDGTPIDLADLNSGEVRNTSRFRGDARPGPPHARHHQRLDGDPPPALQRRAQSQRRATRAQAARSSSPTHRHGLRPHRAAPARDAARRRRRRRLGPALGCEASPASRPTGRHRSLRSLNLAALAAAPGAGDVALTLSAARRPGRHRRRGHAARTAARRDRAGRGAERRRERRPGLERALHPRAARGPGRRHLTASLTLNTAGGTATGTPQTIVKDTVAPAIEANLAPGTYTGVQRIMLTSPAPTGSPTAPTAQPATAADTLMVPNAPIQLDAGTHTITALAIDGAGNRGEASFTYVVDVPAGAAPAGPAAIAPPGSSPKARGGRQAEPVTGPCAACA